LFFTVARILTCPSAKGIYYFNRIRKTGSWAGTEKPKKEWGKAECEAVVPEELWNQVNRIMEEQGKQYKRPGKVPVNPFGNRVWCQCGTKMYARTDSPKFHCRAPIRWAKDRSAEGETFAASGEFFAAGTTRNDLAPIQRAAKFNNSVKMHPAENLFAASSAATFSAMIFRSGRLLRGAVSGNRRRWRAGIHVNAARRGRRRSLAARWCR
jgi:hypothetical protein